MKFFLRNIYLFIVFLSFSSNAQILDPVSWEFETVKITDTEYELVFTADIDNKWSVYSQFIDGLGPVPTSFEFDENSKVEFVGDVIEDKNNRVTEQDPVFGIVVSKFYTEAKFTQKVIIKAVDAWMNEATKEFTFVVKDVVGPTLTLTATTLEYTVGDAAPVWSTFASTNEGTISIDTSQVDLTAAGSFFVRYSRRCCWK